MQPNLRALLQRFNADPAGHDAMLVERLRAQASWVVAVDASTAVQTVRHTRGTFIVAGTDADDVSPSEGLPRTVRSEELWAMAPAGLSDGVVIDPFGPSPVWLDLLEQDRGLREHAA